MSRLKYKYLGRVVFACIFAVIALTIYFLFSPEDSVYFPKCVFHTFTGWDCPGCGSQRALHHMLHFRVTEAFFQNPLLICAIPYILLSCYFEYFGGKDRYPTVCRALFGPKAIYIVLLIVILFWILRNILPITGSGSVL